MVGLDLPLSPLEHHYLLTETIPEIAALEDRTADGRGPRRVHLHAPGPEGHAGRHLRDPSPALVDGRRALGLRRRAPARRTSTASPTSSSSFTAAIRSCRRRAYANGSTAPSPSRRTAIRSSARSRGKRGYWLACGVMAGFLQGGGVGKSLAELMIHGEARGGRLRPRHRPLRRLRLQSRIYQADDRRVLRPPLRHDLSQRAIAGRPAAQDDAGLRRDDGRRLPLGQFLGTGGPALFRAGGFRGKADAQALERLRHRRRRMPHGARGRRPPRYRFVLALRSDRPRGRKLARLDDGRPRCPSPAARASRRCCPRPASSRATSPSSTGATGPSGSRAPTIFANGTCAGSPTMRAKASACATFPTT